MKISFTIDSYVFLLTTVPPDSEAFAALKQARKIDGADGVEKFCLECRPADVEVFLAATAHCDRKRSSEIEHALRQHT